VAHLSGVAERAAKLIGASEGVLSVSEAHYEPATRKGRIGWGDFRTALGRGTRYGYRAGYCVRPVAPYSRSGGRDTSTSSAV
jgi:hypothetical protein